MMEAARTSESLENCYQSTQCCNPEESHLQFVKHLLRFTWLEIKQNGHIREKFLEIETFSSGVLHILILQVRDSWSEVLIIP
jgi:hypothetical protein